MNPMFEVDVDDDFETLDFPTSNNNIQERFHRSILPTSIAVNNMENINLYSIPTLCEEMKKTEKIVDEYKKKLEEEKERRLKDFRKRLEGNMKKIEETIESKNSIRNTESERLKVFSTNVVLVEEGLRTPLSKLILSARDVLEVVFKFIPLKHLISNVSITCWMFHIFVIARADIHVNLHLEKLQKYPLDEVLARYRKIRRFRIYSKLATDDPRNSHMSYKAKKQDITKIVNIVENSKNSLVDLQLEFKLISHDPRADNGWGGRARKALEKRKSEATSCYEEYTKTLIPRLQECRRLNSLVLPVLPRAIPEVTSHLFSLKVLLDTTLLMIKNKEVPLESVNWFENASSSTNDFKSLEHLDLDVVSSLTPHLKYYHIQEGLNSFLAAYNGLAVYNNSPKKLFQPYVKMFGKEGISGLSNLKSLKFILFPKFHNENLDFLSFVSHLDLVKIRLEESTDNTFLFKLSETLLLEKQQNGSVKLRELSFDLHSVQYGDYPPVENGFTSYDASDFRDYAEERDEVKNRSVTPLLNFLCVGLDKITVNSKLRYISKSDEKSEKEHSSNFSFGNSDEGGLGGIEEVIRMFTFDWKSFQEKVNQLLAINSSSSRSLNYEFPRTFVWKEDRIHPKSVAGVCNLINALEIPNLVLGKFFQHWEYEAIDLKVGKSTGILGEDSWYSMYHVSDQFNAKEVGYVRHRSKKIELEMCPRIIEQFMSIEKHLKSNQSLERLKLLVHSRQFSSFGVPLEFVDFMKNFLSGRVNYSNSDFILPNIQELELGKVVPSIPSLKSLEIIPTKCVGAWEHIPYLKKTLIKSELRRKERMVIRDRGTFSDFPLRRLKQLFDGTDHRTSFEKVFQHRVFNDSKGLDIAKKFFYILERVVESRGLSRIRLPPLSCELEKVAIVVLNRSELQFSSTMRDQIDVRRRKIQADNIGRYSRIMFDEDDQ